MVEEVKTVNEEEADMINSEDVDEYDSGVEEYFSDVGL